MALVESILNSLIPVIHRDIDNIDDLVETVVNTRNNNYLSLASTRSLCVAINEHRVRASLPAFSMQALAEQICRYPDRPSLQAYVGTLLEDRA
jgi:hypothetical protein